MNEVSKRNVNLPATGETWSGVWIVAGVMGGPVLLTMLALSVVYSLGYAGTDLAKLVFCGCGFISCVVLLPLAAGLAVRKRERKQEIAGEMMAFFSSRIIELYAVSGISAFAEDPRTDEAFGIYALAEREMEANVENPLLAKETVERGVALVDQIMADNGYVGCREPR